MKTEKSKKPVLDINALNIKTVDVDENRLEQLKDTAQIKTKIAQQIAERLFKNPSKGQSIMGTPNWEHRAAVKKTVLRDLRILARAKGLRARCMEHGNELIFFFEAKKEKKAKGDGTMPLLNTKAA